MPEDSMTPHCHIRKMFCWYGRKCVLIWVDQKAIYCSIVPLKINLITWLKYAVYVPNQTSLTENCTKNGDKRNECSMAVPVKILLYYFNRIFYISRSRLFQTLRRWFAARTPRENWCCGHFCAWKRSFVQIVRCTPPRTLNGPHVSIPLHKRHT